MRGDDEQQRRLLYKLKSELGSEITAALEDDQITDILVNPDGKIFVQSHTGKHCIGEKDPVTARNVINTVAALCDTHINESNPMLNAELPTGERFAAMIQPVVDGPSFSIRKHTHSVQHLESWLENSLITQDQYDGLIEGLRDAKNIIVSGGTGSGKTSFVNALLRKLVDLYPTIRIYSVEDTYELKIPAENHVRTRVSATIDMTMLVSQSLRYNIDRIVVGEVRDREANAMIKAWNTGHPGGLCTIHANSPEEARLRLLQLCSEGANTHMNVIESGVDQALSMVVQMTRPASGIRQVESVRSHA